MILNFCWEQFLQVRDSGGEESWETVSEEEVEVATVLKSGKCREHCGGGFWKVEDGMRIDTGRGRIRCSNLLSKSISINRRKMEQNFPRGAGR